MFYLIIALYAPFPHPCVMPDSQPISVPPPLPPPLPAEKNTDKDTETEADQTPADDWPVYARDEPGATVISYSHFLPRQELLPEKRFLLEPMLSRVVGSDVLREQVQRLTPHLHIVSTESLVCVCSAALTSYTDTVRTHTHPLGHVSGRHSLHPVAAGQCARPPAALRHCVQVRTFSASVCMYGDGVIDGMLAAPAPCWCLTQPWSRSLWEGKGEGGEESPRSFHWRPPAPRRTGADTTGRTRGIQTR